MEKDCYERYYERIKEKKIIACYSDLLCELLLVLYECSFQKVKKSSLLRDIGVINFDSKKSDLIYQNGIKLLDAKYNIKLSSEDPVVFMKK